MAPIGMERNRYTAKKSAMAAVTVFVALAAVPVFADTAQKTELMQPGIPASWQVSQELEQGAYQERFIHRISGETFTGVGRKNSQGKEATLSGTPASLPVSQELEQGAYQERFIRRISGGTFTGVGRKNSQGNEVTTSGTPASLHVSQEQEQSNYQDAYIHRLAGATFPRAHSKQ